MSDEEESEDESKCTSLDECPSILEKGKYENNCNTCSIPSVMSFSSSFSPGTGILPRVYSSAEKRAFAPEDKSPQHHSLSSHNTKNSSRLISNEGYQPSQIGAQTFSGREELSLLGACGDSVSAVQRTPGRQNDTLPVFRGGAQNNKILQSSALSYTQILSLGSQTKGVQHQNKERQVQSEPLADTIAGGNHLGTAHVQHVNRERILPFLTGISSTTGDSPILSSSGDLPVSSAALQTANSTDTPHQVHIAQSQRISHKSIVTDAFTSIPQIQMSLESLRSVNERITNDTGRVAAEASQIYNQDSMMEHRELYQKQKHLQRPDLSLVEMEHMVQLLQMAAKCSSSRRNCCKDSACASGRMMLETMTKKLHLDTHNMLYRNPIVLMTVQALCLHVQDCQNDGDMCCGVPWCRPLSDIIAGIDSYDSFDCSNDEQIHNCICKLSLQSRNTFIQFEPDEEKNFVLFEKSSQEIIEEDVDWYKPGHSYSYGDVILAQSPKDLFVIKKIRCNKGLERIQLWKQICELPSTCQIVKPLWCHFSDKRIYLCSPYIAAMPINGTPVLRTVGMWLLQICSALDHLHKQNLIYLAWTESDVLLNGDQLTLCNLSHLVSCGMLTEGENELAEDAVISLPAQITPPEFVITRDTRRLTTASDVWGVGALLYQLIMGHMLHPSLHHVTHYEACTRLKSHYSSNKNTTSLKNMRPEGLQRFLKHLLMVDPHSRPQIEDIPGHYENMVKARRS